MPAVSSLRKDIELSICNVAEIRRSGGTDIARRSISWSSHGQDTSLVEPITAGEESCSSGDHESRSGAEKRHLELAVVVECTIVASTCIGRDVTGAATYLAAGGRRARAALPATISASGAGGRGNYRRSSALHGTFSDTRKISTRETYSRPAPPRTPRALPRTPPADRSRTHLYGEGGLLANSSLRYSSIGLRMSVTENGVLCWSCSCDRFCCSSADLGDRLIASSAALSSGSASAGHGEYPPPSSDIRPARTRRHSTALPLVPLGRECAPSTRPPTPLRPSPRGSAAPRRPANGAPAAALLAGATGAARRPRRPAAAVDRWPSPLSRTRRHRAQCDITRYLRDNKIIIVRRFSKVTFGIA
ncbi:hypothetical protein EVAR_25621_1 [Eumeta japonica]|uniref:Uncharacterized protein n=1 Tax=Eumeta variegata TaxID=151549 RepID=A0A4C1V222_EUMVA|nr:hypothetical protein EVAR_25621_1 [Eumeta japonica]